MTREKGWHHRTASWLSKPVALRRVSSERRLGIEMTPIFTALHGRRTGIGQGDPWERGRLDRAQ
eukprot:3357297-Prymnesium_polylepis.1